MYRRRDIVGAHCLANGLTGPAADAVTSSVQAMLNKALLSGHRTPGAGSTAAILYPLEECCFAAVVLEMKGWGLSHELARGLRPGFFTWRTASALQLIREGHPMHLALRFGRVAQGRLDRVQPYVWCALHPEGREPDWSPYLPDTRPGPAVERASFTAEWPITGLLQPFLFNLEGDE
ncbi:MAG: hypothetical protein ACWA5A_17680 [Marinibacterium sp.]